LIEASNRTASGFVRKREVATVATTAVRDVRTAVGPSSEARIAVGPSLVLRHEQDDLDFVFVWCIGHSFPSSWEQVQVCWMPAPSPVHNETGTRTIDDAWHRSQALMIQVKCCRNERIAG
jgi:hypothetical protein